MSEYTQEVHQAGNGTGRVAEPFAAVQCASAEQRSRLIITVEDFRRREITYSTVGASRGGKCMPVNASACNISVEENREGIYILEVFADGEQVSEPASVCERSRCQPIRISY